MPVTLPANSVISLRTEYGFGDDVSYNVMHYRLVSVLVTSTGLPSATEPNASDVLPSTANAAYASWETAWSNGISNQVTFTGVTAQKTFPGDRSSPYHYTPADPTTGVVASDPLPMQDAITILKKTGIGQRWAMGRLFLSGIPESQTSGGRITSALMTVYQAYADILGNDLVHTAGLLTIRWRPVVTNLPTAGFPHNNDIIQMVVSNDVVKSQKRRRPGKGI